MPRKRKAAFSGRSNIKDLAVLVIVGLVLYALYRHTLGLWFLVPAWLFLIMTWVLFRMRTWCDYDVRGRGCMRSANGKLGGCHSHKRLKRDAAWAAVGLRNPGLAVRLTWAGTDRSAGRRVGGAGGSDAADTGHRSESTARQGLYNATMWIFTAVSAVASIVMPIAVK